MTTREEVEAAAMRLSPEDREILYLNLMIADDEESMDDSDDEEWDTEILRRIEAVESGREKTVCYEEFWAAAKRTLDEVMGNAHASTK